MHQNECDTISGVALLGGADPRRRERALVAGILRAIYAS